MVDRPRGGRLQQLGSKVLAAIGRQEWIDRPSYRFEHLLSFAYNGLGGARNTVTNALNGVWLGHPVHPPLASLTSGALGTTVALDALSILPGQPASEVVDASRFASRALGVGILASLGSAVTGVTDWQHTHEEDRRVGAVHGLVNVAATALYVQSWWDRRKGRHGRGIVLTALGYGITVGRQLPRWRAGLRVRNRHRPVRSAVAHLDLDAGAARKFVERQAGTRRGRRSGPGGLPDQAR